MPDFQTHLCLTHDGEEHEITVRISYDATYQAAYISGPPEDCHPAEGSMDLTAVEAIGALPDGITQEMLTVAAMQADNRLTQEAWENYHGRGSDDGREDYECSRYQQRGEE